MDRNDCRRCRLRAARVRGNCRGCYAYLHGKVARGLTTWAKLESAGLAAPAVPRSARLPLGKGGR